MSDCRIERIEIVSFGKLKNCVLEPKAGLNVLCAPNESGKSTLASFLKFVFYGYTDGRKKELAENDKKLYTPWDTPKSEGSVFVCKGDKQYRVFRSSVGTKEDCSITDGSTGKGVLFVGSAGEFLFGVSEEVFSRTLFFKQLTLPQNKDGVMAEQLQNLAVSADEQVSSDAALKRLSNVRNELKGRAGNGRIPKLEREYAELERACSQAKADREMIDELRAEQKKQQAQLDEKLACADRLTAELRNIERCEAASRLAGIERIRQDAEKAKDEYETAKAECMGATEQSLASLSDLHGRYLMACEAKQMAFAALPSDTGIQKEKKSVLAKLLPFVCLLGLVACVVLFCRNKAFGIAAFVLELVLAGIEIGSVFKARRAEDAALVLAKQQEELEQRASDAKAVADALREKLTAALAVYSVSLDENTETRLGVLRAACTRADGCRAAYEYAVRAVANATDGVDLPALESLAKDAVPCERDRATAERELHFVNGQIPMLRDRVQRTATAIAAAESRANDPALLAGKKESVANLLAEYRRKYAAYEAARTGIEEAADEMKRMVAPRISELASRYFAVATDGKYRELAVDTRLAMNTKDGGISRESDYLSAGTRDSAYLSLRLALTELLFGAAGMPIVLDDAFGRLDDSRLSGILRALSAASAKHQIFLLCCTDRERNALGKAALPYHTLAFGG